jgi:pectate lyase
MKRILLIVCCSIIFVVSLFGQAASSTWALTANQSAVVVGSVTAANQTLSNMQVSYPGIGQRSSPTGTAGTWPAGTEEPTRYMQFAVSPAAGNYFTVNSISMKLYINSGSNGRANVYYSKDVTFATKTQIGTTITLSTAVPGTPNVTVNPNTVINNGETLYLRIYPWETGATTGKYVITNNVVISGTTQSLVAVITSLEQLTGFVQQSSSTPSAVQTYTINGTSLTNGVVITPPAGFEISTDGGATWNGNSSPVTLPVSSGVITGQPITVSVRLNAPAAGLYSGVITHTSTGAPETDIAVSGVRLATEPDVVSNLSFSNATGSSMTIGFTGGNGNDRIVVMRAGSLVNWLPTDGVPAGGVNSNFTSATDQGNGNKIVYNGSGTSVNVSGLSSNMTYYVSVFEYNVATGNSQNYLTSVSANGTKTTLAVQTLSISKVSLSFGSVLVDATSAELTYALSGAYLTPDAGNVTVTAPSGFEISTTSGSGFTSSLLIPYSGNTLSSTTIYVRFKPTSLIGYSGSISHSGGSAPSVTVAVNGTGVSESALANTPIGYASCNGGTTGGTGGTVTTVTNLTELQAFVTACENNTTPRILYIRGKISASSTTVMTIKHGANISIYGEGSTGELENVGLNIRDYQNVIVRYMKIHEVIYPNDALTIDECQNVWVDHNELYSKIGVGIGVDTYDGLLDIKNGSRYVTVSWNYLHHHMKCSLIGHTDDTDQQTIDSQMRITYHHNWFSYTEGRNPSIRFGAIHMFNNYFEEITDYGIAARDGAHAKIENCHYHYVKLPMSTDKFPVSGLPNGYISESGNIFTDTCGANVISQTGSEWWTSTTLPYSYTLDPVETVANTVKLLAGFGNPLSGTSGIFTATRTLNAPSAANVGNLGAIITSSANLGLTTVTRGGVAQTGSGHTGIKRYYDITPTTNTGLNATLVFSYSETELNGIAEANLRLFKSTDGGSTWVLQGGTVDAGANTVTLTGINSFSRWTLGEITGPLPVQMTSFTAVMQGASALLNWTTATETNNAGFKIERSVEGSGVWIVVTFVNGAGTSNIPNSYSYEDKDLAPGAYIYRIKQIDNDGSYEYYNANTSISGVVSAVDAGVSNTFQLCGNYPNPFNPATKMQFSVPQDGYASLKVYNMLGQEVATLFSGIAKAGHYIPVTFNGPRFASGVYFSRLQYNGKSLVQRMLLMK